MNELDLFCGGEELLVTLADQTTQRVRVGEIRIRHLNRYQAAIGDEEAMAELFCQQPQGWAATLTNRSLEEILAKGEEINRPPLARKLQRELERTEAFQPGTKARLDQMIQHRLNAQLSGSAPAPVSS